jgi:hypothetical protein
VNPFAEHPIADFPLLTRNRLLTCRATSPAWLALGVAAIVVAKLVPGVDLVFWTIVVVSVYRNSKLIAVAAEERCI